MPDDNPPCRLPEPGPEQAGSVSHAIFRLARLHRMRAGQLLRRIGLYPSQEMVMMQLWERGPQRQSDLAAVLGADAATMTKTVRRLEHAGFVRRCPSPTDGRVTIIEATKAGNALREAVEQIWVEIERDVVGDLSPEELAEAAHLFSRIEHNLTSAASPAARPRM